MAEKLIIDASAMVDYLVDSPLAGRVADRIRDSEFITTATGMSAATDNAEPLEAGLGPRV